MVDLPGDKLKCVVWNCNGLGLVKRSHDNFLSVLTENQIIVLTESWAGKRTNLELDGYKCYNFYRKFRHRNAKRNCGGAVIYVKNNIKDEISIVKNSHDTLIWLKLDKKCFCVNEDLYICVVYMWQEHSAIATI